MSDISLPADQGGESDRNPETAFRANPTAPGLRRFKQRGVKIVMVTAYDYPSALIAEKAGVDCILVGDSVGTAVLGYDTTLPVTIDEMIYHTRAVRRGVGRALVITDLPFGTYQASPDDAVRNASRLLKEGGAQAVKVEGGAQIVETVRRLTLAGIPVFGHLGLTPQSVHIFGGHRAQGKEPEAAREMIEDAIALERAGAFGLVLETIPAALAEKITAAIAIPTIGIGAGSGCDGQVLVWHDLLGLTNGRTYRHVKRFAELGAIAETSIRAYSDEVRQGTFPTKEHSL